MVMPNFLIIGDTKAGTTSLYSYLRQHPEVYMPSELKELRYFAFDRDNSYQVRAGSTRVTNLTDYLGYFEKCGNAKVIGEASPNYLRSPGAAQRIREQIPSVKLIVCLRHPAERLHSLYQMHYRERLTRQPFDEYLFSQNAIWIKGNFYWPDLNNYFQHFDSEQIQVILFDDLKASSDKVVKSIYSFLGVDTSFVPDLTPQNTGGMPNSDFLYRFVFGSKDLLRKLGTPPAALRSAWSRMRKKLVIQTEIDTRIRRKILEVCRDDIFRTQELIRRDLSMWLN
jgi:hypothetical protein